MLRLTLLFVHVASAMGIFAAMGIEGLMLFQLRRASSAAEARMALKGVSLMPRVGATSLLLAIVSGSWLATAYWAWNGAWMEIGAASIVIVAALGGAVTRRRLAPLARSLADPAAAGRPIAVDPLLVASFQARLAIATGIVYIMTTKPALGGSLAAMGVALALGAAAFVAAARGRARAA